MAMQHHFEVQAECKSCRSTGLYVGFGEHDGVAVVCHTCKGTGEVTLSLDWDNFTGRKPREGVTHILQCNPGIIVGDNPEKDLDAEVSFGGMSYFHWETLQDPCDFGIGTEMRDFTCPAWWYQTADYSKKPDWDECRPCGMFSGCKHFSRREDCWARWDVENAKEDETDGE